MLFRSKNGIPASTAHSFKEHALPVSYDEVASLVGTQQKPFVLIDTSASAETYKLIEIALQAGGFVVSSNKKPFSSEYALFDQLQKYKHHVYFETTVGAGLPIISTIRDLIETGDEIVEMSGCFSGTLGFLFTKLGQHMPFSQAVNLAKEQGYTEPDPRDDLSGLDVARKALILSRCIGIPRELSEISLSSLFASSMASGRVEDFMLKIKTLDEEYAQKMVEAAKRGNTYKYVARITRKTCTVGMQEVAQSSDIGSLRGPDNIVVIKTKRYFENPLVIKGPGAGLEVTAAGVFGDVLKIIRGIKN